MGSGSQFSAVDATLGYIYQVRSALLWALRRSKDKPNFLVSIEMLDDVAFETPGGNATDLLQTKHHRKRTASLTDSSSDLWKTLRIWFEAHAFEQIPPTANLYLVTTCAAPDDTAASRLRAAPRDVAAAQHALDAVASSSTNKTNKRAYEAYLSATATERTALLKKITIIDAAPLITDLDGELLQEVYWAAAKGKHAAFLDRLEGWWLRRVVRQLTDAAQERISSLELEAQMADLREQFRREALPIDDDILELSVDDAMRATYGEYVFVRQMEIIKVGGPRIALAIQDYYKAFTQRSRWLREELVVGIDLCKYENRLCDEWTREFESMLEDLGDTATDAAKETAARSVLKWADNAVISLRPSVTEPFVSRGSLHMLSDEVRIGWHPEFRDRLALLLSDKEGIA